MRKQCIDTRAHITKKLPNLSGRFNETCKYLHTIGCQVFFPPKWFFFCIRNLLYARPFPNKTLLCDAAGLRNWNSISYQGELVFRHFDTFNSNSCVNTKHTPEPLCIPSTVHNYYSVHLYSKIKYSRIPLFQLDDLERIQLPGRLPLGELQGFRRLNE